MWAIESRDNIPVSTKDMRPRDVEAFAVDGTYFEIKNMEVASGRLIAPHEFAGGAKVVVIGQDVAKHFFPTTRPARAASSGSEACPIAVIGDHGEAGVGLRVLGGQVRRRAR